MKHLFLAALIELPSSAFADTKCQSTPYDLPTPVGYNHAKYAPSPVDRLYDGKSFIASIDGDGDDDKTLTNGDAEGEYLVEPQWVAMHVKSYLNAEGKAEYAPGWKRPTWYKIPLFDEERDLFHTSKRIDDSYKGVGNTWNRGHLAQRADANRLGEEYGCNTHVFAYAFPQHAKLNQGIWLAMENYVSSLANQLGELWLFPGRYLAKHLNIGDANEVPVAVPQEAFKVVIWETNNGSLETLAFIYPNNGDEAGYKTGKCKSDKTYDHSPYFSSIAEIEQLTGLEFFNGKETALKQKKTTSLPFVKKQYHIGSCL
jgi:endonuclease G